MWPHDVRAETDRAIGMWLFSVAGMVAIMVVIGGITRLTGSGLSMVEWRPLIGWLPPLSEEAWLRAFALYQNSPEYLKVNAWMGLDDFRQIFWWEYVHRLWGRLIGLAFVIPFAWLLISGRVRASLIPRLLILFVLGGLQGAVGWWMVKSGLVDDPAVSQYRLTAHLGIAFLILGALLWTGLSLASREGCAVPRTFYRHALLVMVLVSVTVLVGAMVAGMHAGMIYNTFPLMAGGLLPPDYANLSPLWLNALENPAAIQFHHRVMAVVTVVIVMALLFRVARSDLPPQRRLPAHALAGAVLVQAALGITTLLFVVPIDLAAAHQAGAVGLFAVSIWVVHEYRGSISAR
ncbi:MAG: COX15/CtaA family protein [Alphaproteobacteria bacterium]|nr:COX15/CtaA family protein [Alphaproteobacteria bacterium]